MSWIDKIREVITGFLASQNSKYITTESGLKIQILDHESIDAVKTDEGVWSDKLKTI